MVPWLSEVKGLSEVPKRRTHSPKMGSSSSVNWFSVDFPSVLLTLLLAAAYAASAWSSLAPGVLHTVVYSILPIAEMLLLPLLAFLIEVLLILLETSKFGYGGG